jgi:hypothetical protein
LKLVAQDRVRLVDGRCTIEGARVTDAVLSSPCN